MIKVQKFHLSPNLPSMPNFMVGKEVLENL